MKELTQQQKDNIAALEAEYRGEPWEYRLAKGGSEWTSPGGGMTVVWYLKNDFICRPKPEPKTRPWSKPEDVPMNCWIRRKGYSERHAGLVVYLFDFFLDVGGIGRLKYKELSDYEYSTDRMTWNKPEVTEP